MCIAGAAKVVAGRSWIVEATSLGAPRAAIPLVPWIEISTGALLIARWQQNHVAIIVGLMLIAFTVLIVGNLARGRRPNCACFGTWSSRRLGWGHVLRNLALLALAAVLVI